jgi:peptidoglycan/LPS O-acetylase OafA/YrhL
MFAVPSIPSVETSSSSISSGNRNIPALTGLRAVAACLILLLHSWNGVHIDKLVSLDKLFRPALGLWIGVDLFFVLSAYLLTRNLLRTVDEKHYFWNFYVGRCLRIMPLYYLVLIIALVVALCTGFSTYTTMLLFGGMAVFLSNFLQGVWNFGLNLGPVPLGHFWSLAVEEHFYCLWPFVVRKLNAKKLIWFCPLIICIELVLRCWAVFKNINPDNIYELSFFRFDTFAAGAFVACLYHLHSDGAHTLRLSRIVLAFTFPLTLILAVCTHFYKGNVIMETVGYTVLALTFGSLISDIVGSNGKSVLSLCLTNRFLLFMGKHSYAIYLFHLPLVTGTNHCLVALHWNKNAIAVVVLGVVLPIVLTVVLSVLVWHLIEKPCLNLKRQKYRDDKGHEPGAFDKT